MGFNNLNRIPRRIDIPIPKDEDGFVARECPNSFCEGYFKIRPGTGLKGKDLPCYCPYCGHPDGQNQFATKDQVEFVKSVVHRQLVDAIRKDLKSMEFDIKPRVPSELESA